MKKKSLLTLLSVFSLASAGAHAQQQQQTNKTTTTVTTSTTTNTTTASAAARATTNSAGSSVIITATSTPIELARAALASLGGDKFRNLKSLVVAGSADLYSPNSTQALPAKFAIISAGDLYRLEIQSPVFNMQQIFDGQRSYSSVRGFELPSPNKFGFSLLTRFDREGYTVTALPDKKKLRGFRITEPEGSATDFYIDAQTGRVISYESTYNGLRFGVENKQFKEFEGVLIPISFVQKFDTPQGSFFAEFKVKDVKVNQTLADDMFVIPSQ